ncbi:DUF2510 domain-containing protein [Cellulomonas sp.]|uniref:DUF2510 domain-containing protein n=1 Tax=Cellulomonas sp. TaxID=40001 RepID=UPI001B01F567|nr:DUF2510 domain-containing protein [Cellulomonas sp.]MBO9556442.1 DUF2510 domain-containing protein [Cellulomonas sp.]
MTSAQAGWYPDPQLPDQLRYWDGRQWTGYLVDTANPGVVRYERPPWSTGVPGIDWPLTIAVTSAL